MLTPRAGRVRDWALFAVVALAPAALVAVLGFRALANEEAASLREAARALDAAGERVSLDVHQRASAATETLRRASLEGDGAAIGGALRAMAPPFAEPIVLTPNRTLLWPPSPNVPQLPAPRRCAELASALATGGPRNATPNDSGAKQAGRAELRREILASCQEARTSTGRWLWPVVALESMSPDDGEAFARWVDTHADLLGAAEREATLIETREAQALAGATRERAVKALAAPASRREALATEFRSEEVAAALRKAPDASGILAWTAGASLGVVRALDDGRLAGFVVHRGSVADALSSGALRIEPGHRAVVLAGVAAGAGAVPGQLASPNALSTIVRLAPELAVVITPSDPGAVLRHASRSRILLAAIAVAATFGAFAVAAFLFARMRAARRSSELRTDFVSAVSHELRTPIASVRMLAELLEEGRVEEAERGEVYEALAKEARRLGETVDRLLGFSRMAAGRYAVARERANVGDAVRASVDTFEERNPSVPRVERAIEEALDADIDTGQIRLAVDNLLENARKYAPGGTPYRVGVRTEGGGVRIDVADGGPGILPRDQRRIFQPFERADDRLSRATEGSGIGLSLVRHVARAHGGEARVRSEPGRGATFTIWIPMHGERTGR